MYRQAGHMLGVTERELEVGGGLSAPLGTVFWHWAPMWVSKLMWRTRINGKTVAT